MQDEINRLIRVVYKLQNELELAKIHNDEYKQALNEIKELTKQNNFLVRDPFCGSGYRDLSGEILGIINKFLKDN